MVAITLSHVSVSMGTKRLLDDVSCALDPGKLTGIIGPNGAGKTTLLRAAAGLVPFDGEIMLAEKSVAQYSARERARRLAYLAQGREVGWNISVAALAALGRLPHADRETPVGDDAVQQALAQTDCLSFATRRVHSLSGGELARVLLARALATQPQILLADEPVAHLDPYYQLKVMQILKARAHAGLTVGIVLHDLTLAVRWCDQVIVLHEGRVIASGEPRAVLSPALIQQVFSVQMISGERDGEPFLIPWSAD